MMFMYKLSNACPIPSSHALSSIIYKTTAVRIYVTSPPSTSIYTLLPLAPFNPHLQLSLWRLKSWEHEVADITSCLVEVEAHPLAAKTLGDNVELQAVYSQYYSKFRIPECAYLFSLIM